MHASGYLLSKLSDLNDSGPPTARGLATASRPRHSSPAVSPQPPRGPLRPTLLLGLLLVPGCRAAHPPRATHRDRAGEPASQAAAPVITEPTVVAFWLPASDTLQPGAGADLLDDFRSYTSLVAADLDDAGIALVATTSDSVIVQTEQGPRRIVMLGGLDYPFGYVLVDPGMPETILTGVSTDDELMDQVDWYFGVDDAEPDSVPGQVVLSPAIPRAPAGRAPPL